MTDTPIIIEPRRGWLGLPFAELWHYRELLYFLIWREIKVRYKQSVLGILWIVLQPLVTMIVFTLLFHQLLGVESGSNVPYPVFAYAALLPWSYFAGAINRGALSLVGDKNLIAKVYFPRLIIPLAHVLAGLVDLGVAFAVLLGMLLLYGIEPATRLLLLPGALLLTVLTALGTVLWLSALNVQYRDVKYATAFLVQLWMYATPIIYPISRIPDSWRPLYDLNPMVAVVQSFRWALLGDALALNWYSLLPALLLFVSGIVYFRQAERIFADVV